jgi:glycosidase
MIMKPWPKNPIIYEINTWVWLEELGKRLDRPVNLGNIPAKEWDAVASLGADAVWFMGVWERSPAGIRIAMENEGLRTEFQRVLPDLTPDDVVGSPYCVRRYLVDGHLGGREGLAFAREQLARRGVRLLLDYVPNHVAPDHPWVFHHPDYFIRGDSGDLHRDPRSFLEVGGAVFACGRDPYFPAWPDVLQLNAFHPGFRRAAIETVSEIASQCDGMRCDMAMLFLNFVFERTWGRRAGPRPELEYWPELIQAVRREYPEVIFIAEAYWDLEWELQQQGFDFCYDKRLYDRLEHDGPESISPHLSGDIAYQNKLVRFIENHDEPRAAATFSPEKERSAAVTIATLPGARLFHEGQFEGRKVRLPVFLGRRPEEAPNQERRDFYRRLLKALNRPDLAEGEWRLCERNGWPDNQSHRNLIAWCWRLGEARHLIVVNLSEFSSQGLIKLPWNELGGHNWRLTDELSEDAFDRDGNQLVNPGLYVDLAPWHFHFLRFLKRASEI